MVHTGTLSAVTMCCQVKAMQQYSVLVGVVGAGMMNGLYLPPYGVAVQIVPYKITVSSTHHTAVYSPE